MELRRAGVQRGQESRCVTHFHRQDVLACMWRLFRRFRDVKAVVGFSVFANNDISQRVAAFRSPRSLGPSLSCCPHFVSLPQRQKVRRACMHESSAMQFVNDNELVHVGAMQETIHGGCVSCLLDGPVLCLCWSFACGWHLVLSSGLFWSSKASMHPATIYAGSPFSTGRSDDCAPVSAGTRAGSLTCDRNKYGHHAPLCACKDKTGR